MHHVFPQMHQNGILKTDDLITRFFRLCTEMCVDLCYRALGEQTHSPTVLRAKCFHTLDAFVRLIALLVKHSGDTANTITKINLLNKVSGHNRVFLWSWFFPRMPLFQYSKYMHPQFYLLVLNELPDCNHLFVLNPSEDAISIRIYISKAHLALDILFLC